MNAPPVTSLPWKQIALAVVCVLIGFWLVGFAAGLAVRFFIWWW